VSKKRRIIYRDERGRIISKYDLSKKLARNGLTLSDYERGRKALERFGSKSPVKDLFKSLKEISEDRFIEEDYKKLVQFLNEMPRNKGKAFLNDKRIGKASLSMFIADYPRSFDTPFQFFYLNHKISGIDIYVYLDDELLDLVNESELGDMVRDSYGNVVQISS